MIYGIGIDLVENDRIEKIIAKWGGKFLERVFCENEIKYCARHVQFSLHYAARFAAKESFLKALGIGMGRGVHLKDVEVTHDAQGKPIILAHNQAALQLKKNKIAKIHLSITHTRTYAAAFLILEKG